MITNKRCCQLALMCVSLLALSCADPSEETIDKPGPSTTFKPVYGYIKYGDLPRNNAQIHDTVIGADSSAHPLIIFVHGGGWCEGSVQQYWSRTKSDFFGRNGIMTLAINYSLSPMPYQVDNPNRIKHPSHVMDLAKAIKWAVDNASKYRIDTGRIYLMGHSAGAQIVCLAATNERFLKEYGLDLSVIRGVISLDGGAYLTLDEKLMFPPDNGPNADKAALDIKQAYYNAFSTDSLVHLDASPYHNIVSGKGIPPFLLISQGQEVAYRYIPNTQMKEKLTVNGIEATHIPASGYDHMKVLDMIGSADDKQDITKEVLNFIDNYINK